MKHVRKKQQFLPQTNGRWLPKPETYTTITIKFIAKCLSTEKLGDFVVQTNIDLFIQGYTGTKISGAIS